ncbi:MAG: helix-turn-helix domain-containing protein [Candidatus Pacearchaeota archaeon]
MNEDEKIFFERNKLAKKVLYMLKDKEFRAVPLSKELNKHRPEISRTLKKLKDKGYVECTKPESPNYRPYKITKKGKSRLKELFTL